MPTEPPDQGAEAVAAIIAAAADALGRDLSETTDRIVDTIVASNAELVERLDRLLEVMERFERGVTGG